MPDLTDRIAGLPPVERQIVELVVGRLEIGLGQYGRWKLGDGRDYVTEGLDETLDLSVYLCAALLRQRDQR